MHFGTMNRFCSGAGFLPARYEQAGSLPHYPAQGKFTMIIGAKQTRLRRAMRGG